MRDDSVQTSRLRDRIREEISASILAAAEELIAEEGLGARIERIAARAGVSVGTIYNHFVDRSGLLQALFDTRGDRMRASLDRAISLVRESGLRDQVRALMRAMAGHGREHGRLMAALAKEDHAPALLRPPAVSPSVLEERCAAIVRQGVEAGELREDPHGVFVAALAALARQSLACAVEGRCNDAEIDALADLFLRGVSR